MKLTLLLLLSVTTSFAAEDTCDGRCQDGFDPKVKCQCDTLCKYYRSCCMDYDTTCRTKITRGDVFELPEENVTSTISPNTTAAPSTTPDTSIPDRHLDTETCSGKSFDAFLQAKNGSIYAFRGEYFFELDETSVMPGYPKLIKDVWGVSGPVDAAFTRINCQGTSYIFKGKKYWRFDGDVLDRDYPRDISVGFENIPDDVDTAFAVPAPAHNQKEKVYFFKGDQYYQYEFKQQPSHEDCVRMTKASPSVLFTQYTDLYCDYTLDDLFASLFQDSSRQDKWPRSITRHWMGIKPPIDAALVSRVYLSSTPFSSSSLSPPSPPGRRSRNRGGRRRKSKGKGSRSGHSDIWGVFGLDYEERRFLRTEKQSKSQKKGQGRHLVFDDYSDDSTDYADLELTRQKATPVQNVYFFQKDKYYRVALQTKHIDQVNPPYPRSIGKYWLGCKERELAEKR